MQTQNNLSVTEHPLSRSVNLNKTSTNAISPNSLNDPTASLISYSRVMHQHTQRQMATICDADRTGIGKDNHSSTSDHNHQTHETSSTIITGDGHSQEHGCTGGVSS